MACCKKGKGVQKVVIPKGMINPGETTIIEIPSNLQKQPIVVAKRKTSIDSVSNKRGNDRRIGAQRSNDSREQGGSTTKASKPRDRDRNVPTNSDLDSTERKEREQFLRDLEEFQRARRKLLSNASFLAGEKTQFKKK